MLRVRINWADIVPCSIVNQCYGNPLSTIFDKLPFHINYTTLILDVHWEKHWNVNINKKSFLSASEKKRTVSVCNKTMRAEIQCNFAPFAVECVCPEISGCLVRPTVAGAVLLTVRTEGEFTNQYAGCLVKWQKLARSLDCSGKAMC